MAIKNVDYLNGHERIERILSLSVNVELTQSGVVVSAGEKSVDVSFEEMGEEGLLSNLIEDFRVAEFEKIIGNIAKDLNEIKGSFGRNERLGNVVKKANLALNARTHDFMVDIAEKKEKRAEVIERSKQAIDAVVENAVEVKIHDDASSKDADAIVGLIKIPSINHYDNRFFVGVFDYVKQGDDESVINGKVNRAKKECREALLNYIQNVNDLEDRDLALREDYEETQSAQPSRPRP